MRQIKTARGKTIDMTSLVDANAEKPAVSPGNVNLNTRGDRIDSQGNVIVPKQKVAMVQHENATSPEIKKLSEVEEAIQEPTPESMTKPKKASMTKKISTKPKIVSEEEKVREDGTKYLEIEYANGDIETKEIVE